MSKLIVRLVLSLFFIFVYSVAQGDTLLPPSSELEQIYTEIDNIEIESGSYAPEMGELWLALGQALRRNSDYEQAIDVVSRGMHVDKVNFGLFSLSQALYLKELAQLENLRGDPVASVKYTEKVYDLYSKMLIDDTPRLFEETLGLKKLHLDMYRDASARPHANHLTSAYYFALEAAVIAEKHMKDKPQTQQSAYRALADVSYEVASTLASRPPRQYSKLRFATGATADLSSVEEDMWLHTTYRTGTQALLANVKVGEKSNDATTFDRAQDMAMLADWHLMFGMRISAAKTYQQAWDQLAKDPEKDVDPDEYFGEPMPIAMATPDFGYAEAPTKFNIDVTRTGLVRRAEIIEGDENLNKESRRNLIARVKSLVFRPKLSNGKPVATTKFEYSLPVMTQ